MNKKKIKLAHVIGALNYGGAENQVVQILNGLNPLRFDKYLMTFKNVDTPNRHALGPEINYIEVPLRRWGQIGCIFRLYRLFKKLKVDVAQSHMFHTNLYVAIAAKLAGVPAIITTEHGKNHWKRPVHHLIEKRIISPLVTKRVAVSGDIRDIRITSGDVTEDKITCIAPCVKICRYTARNKHGQKLRIGTVGRLVAAKDYGTLIMGFKKLIDNDIHPELVFVGDGPERSKLERMAVESGIAEDVTFTGFRADIDSFLGDFDIFVLSSIREGLPVAMLEAMAMHLPVVATRVGGIPEVIRDNVNGLLVESRNPEMIADAMKRLIEERSLRKKLGGEAFRTVKNLFSREAICSQYEKLYINLLGRV